MMTSYATHRLDGLEPDNLLAFMALLGLLRTLEEVTDWRPRVSWTVEKPPLRPALRVPQGVDHDAIVQSAAEGLDLLAQYHEFDGLADLTLPPENAARKLREITSSTNQNRYIIDLWAALVSDAAISRDGEKVEPTPLCLMFGQGHQHFLKRLKSVPQQKTPPERGQRRSKITVSEELSLLTVAPRRRVGEVRLTVLGGQRESHGDFIFRWPIWRAPISLAAIRALLNHPGLHSHNKLAALGVTEVRQARRISTGKFMNFTRAEPTISS